MAVKSSTPRSSSAPPPVATRIRCAHCGMPVRRSLPACWSCGLVPDDPTSTRADAEAAGLLVAAPAASARHRAARLATIIAGGLVLGAAVAIIFALVVPDDHSSALRKVADRVRGDDWRSFEQPSFSIDFPVDPRRLPGAPGADGVPSDLFEATDAGTTYRVETAAADPGATDGRVLADSILSGHLAKLGATAGANDRTTVVVDGARGVDATIKGHRLRAVVLGHRAFLFDVAGVEPAPGFERFTSSFTLLDR